MVAKLTDITPSYSSFEDDQVLTAKQLNTFLNYFDDQDRMSRICLSGVGIVCGFEVKYNGTDAVALTQGCGITTDGDLFHLWKNTGTEGLKTFDFPEIVYDKYVKYTDDKGDYQPYFYEGGVLMDFWELLPTDSTAPSQPLSSLTGHADMVVLLYLESYSNDSDLCVGINCDNLGVEEVQNLRVLLVSQDNAKKILNHDKIFKPQDLFDTYMELSDAVVQRVVLNQTNSMTIEAMSNAYKAAINADGLVASMRTSIETMLNKLQMVSDGSYISTKIGNLFSTGSMPPDFFQYRYDLLRDVVDTYMEMKELFLHSSTDCCPDIKSFPKHLMLGVLDPTDHNKLYNDFRHSFYKSPILGHGHENFEKFKSLVARMRNQLDSYNTGTLPAGPVKITPSKFGTYLLEDKAIPYYYKLNDSTLGIPLLKSWDYEKTLVDKQNRNLSYHTNFLQNIPAIQTPLKYNLEPFNFLRIEGAQGLTYTNAMSQINALKTSNGLSFDLKALSLAIPATSTVNVADYPCEFSDLNSMLDVWRAEFECILGNASYYLSGYSVDTAWDNVPATYYYDTQLKKSVSMSSLGSDTENNPVFDNLDTSPRTTGKYLRDTYLTYVGCSANDLIFQTFQAMKDLKFPNFTPYQHYLTIRGPIEILAYGLEFFNGFPPALPQWTETHYNTISLNAAYICAMAKNYQGVADGDLPAPSIPVAQSSSNSPVSVAASAVSKSATAAKAGRLSNYVPIYNEDFNNDFLHTPVDTEPVMARNIMNQLLTICCSVSKLQSIMTEIEQRKQKIALNQKLSEFIKKHPGLEHFAGTKHGGTFLLVYTPTAVGTIAANTVIADFSLPYLCCSDCS